MTELSALVSPHSLTCDHACAFCSYPDAGSGLLQKTSGSWGRCPVPGAPSCCPRSLPLWQATAPSLQHLLFAPLFHHIFQGRYQSHQCLQVHVHQHWPTHFLACFHVGIQGHFKVISKPTHTRHHFAKGASLLQGWDPVSDRHSPSRPNCGIERMAHLSVTRSPKSSIWSPCSLALLTGAEISLSLRPLWLPRWFRVSHLLFLPAPSQSSFRCSPNFCCVPLWLLICTAAVTIAKQNMNMSVSSLIFSTIHTLTAFGVRSKIPGMDSASRTSCPRPHTIPWSLQSRLADGRWSKTKQKL